jgi:hypothetical protein
LTLIKKELKLSDFNETDDKDEDFYASNMPLDKDYTDN